MEASDNPAKNTVPLGRRYYSGLITTFELLRVLGLIGAVLWGFAFGQISGGLGFITFLTSALTIYISLTSCIAIIDLLSKIEFNTRKNR